MKVIAYAARPYQLPYLSDAAQRLGMELVTTPEPLTADTVELAAGCNAIADGNPLPYPEAVFLQLQKFGIQYYSCRAAGVDVIDFGSAKRHGIRIANVPAYSPNAIAELAVALSLTLLRNLQSVLPRAASRVFDVEGFMGREVRNQTVGIVGTGKIGYVAGQIFRGFGARVLGYDPFPNPRVADVIEYRDSLDDLLSETTLLSLHSPLTAENHHLVGHRELSLLPQGALVVNTARGGLIDADALYRSLVGGHLGGAALDVFEGEGEIFERDHFGDVIPNETFRLLSSLPNVVVTPHIAFKTDEAVKNMCTIALENLASFIASGECANEVHG